MDNFEKLKNKLDIKYLQIGGNCKYYNQIYNNCCLLNSIIYIIMMNGSNIFKDDTTIDDGIILYNFLKQRGVKLDKLGDPQQDNILEDVSKIFNLKIALYDKLTNILYVYKKSDKDNDYLKNIIIYVGGHFDVGKINLEETLEKKLEIIKQLEINVVEIENTD